MLANVYLHYALDLWFQEVVKVHMRGEACLIRYADDFVCAFEYEADAKAFFKALGFRLEKFGLQLAADKTRVMHFSRSNQPGSTRFDFLGFEFRWDKDRAGNPHVARRTSRKKLRNSIANFTEWCKQNRNVRLKVLFPQLNRKLRGYYNYYGVTGNAVGLNAAKCLADLKPDAEASISEEPGARKPHAGICAGAARVTGCPTALALTLRQST